MAFWVIKTPQGLVGLGRLQRRGKSGLSLRATLEKQEQRNEPGGSRTQGWTYFYNSEAPMHPVAS